MKKMLPPLFFFSALAFVMPAGTLWAGVQFLDPEIPDGETIVYSSRSDDHSTTIHEKVELQKQGDNNIYIIRSSSPSLDRTIRIKKESMAVLSVATVRKFQQVTLDSVLKVINERPNDSDDEIKIADFNVLRYLLRGFPFSNRKNLKIGYYGEEKKKKFTFSIALKKKETIKISERSIDCYNLEFGIDGFWGNFTSKLKLWYSVDAPHYLVRYEGSEGPPGTPKKIIELVSYTKP